MTIRNTPIRLTLACLGTALLLTACTTPSPEAGRPNTSAPTTTPPASSTTPSTSTTPATPLPSTPPERPAAANGLTLAAAEAFVRHYSDLTNYASDTGDAASMLAASDTGCENCKSYADFVKVSNAANGLISGDHHERITQIAELVRGESGRLGGSATVNIGAYTSREKAGATPVHNKAKTYTLEFALSPRSNNWVMYEMKLVEQ